MSSDRKGDLKKSLSADDTRRRRGDVSVRIRKNKREEGLQKRRAMLSPAAGAPGPAAAAAAAPGDGAAGAAGAAPSRRYAVSDIPELLGMLGSADGSALREGVRGFRKLLSCDDSPPVLKVIECGALPQIMSCLLRNDDPELQFEACWALTNVASTEYTKVVVEGGAVPSLVQLLLHHDHRVREQSAWCLGNITGDCPALRDVVLGAGGLGPLIMNVTNPANDALLRNCTWALSNFCRGKPLPPLPAVSPAVPVLSGLLAVTKDKDVLMDACWALSYLSDQEDERIECVVSSGAVPHLVRCLSHEDASVVTPALRTLGNVVSGSDAQTQSVLDAGALRLAPQLLSHPKRTIRKEVCWMLSNVAAGTAAQLEALCAAPNVLRQCVAHMDASREWEVRKESAWVVGNVLSGKKASHAARVVEDGGVAMLCAMLEADDARVVRMVLDALDQLLDTGRRTGHLDAFVQLVDECGGIDALERLQDHANEAIYAKCVKIIEEYFGEDEQESENVAPNVTDAADAFTFGIAAAPEKGTQAAQPDLHFAFGAPLAPGQAPAFF